jgi:hypothetical protein
MKKRIISFMLSCMILASSASPAQEREGGGNIIISSFSTSVSHQGDAVKQNIAMACEKLNGVVITPGQVFSFNETVGEGSARNGYQDGAVLYRDSIVMEAGEELPGVLNVFKRPFFWPAAVSLNVTVITSQSPMFLSVLTPR